MFEKEAEEYLKKDGTETEKMLNNITLSLTSRQAFVLKNAFKQTFKDGAEFGYNKANLKLRNCMNCKYHSFWGDELKCNYGLKEALQEDKLVECHNLDKWEMKECY